MHHLSCLIKSKHLANKNETPRRKMSDIIAKITNTLNRSLVTQYCVRITEIIKHDATKP